MKGFDPSRIASTLADYQFMIVLQYDGLTVLQATLQGRAATMEEPEEEDDNLREMHIVGESYKVPLWLLDAEMDLAWLAKFRDPVSEAAGLGVYERFREEMVNFLDAAYDDYDDVAAKLVLTVTAFRASDQRTSLLIHRSPDTGLQVGDDPNIVFTTQPQAKAQATSLLPPLAIRPRPPPT